MKKLFIACAMFLSMNAMAGQSAVVDVSKLTKEQQIQVLQIVQEKAEEAPAKKVDAVLSRVEQFGASAARGLVGFAKEIGTEANNFAKTPLGMVVAGFTVLHFFGHEITSLIVGSFFLFIVTPIMVTLFIKSFKTKDYQYDYKPYLFGAWQRRVVTKVDSRYMTDAEGFKTTILGLFTAVSFGVGIANFVI